MYGQEDPSPPSRTTLHASIPLIDIPFQSSDGRHVFSMRQSIDLSKSYYQVTYPLLSNGLDLNGSRTISPSLRLPRLVLFVSYILASSYLPLGDAWVHEEYHRAVLKNRGVDSYDNIYDLKLFGDSVSVSRVQDEALVELKKKYPHDLIRSHAAGYESDNQLITALEKDAFFLGTSPVTAIVLFNILNDYLYISTSASDEANTITDEMNRAEGTIQVRDFTGLDFTAWVYDLFRPYEDYMARGTHPSGIGIDRYIKNSDLTEEEKRFLKKQGDLSLLNFVNVIFITGKPLKMIHSGQEFLVNIRPRHYLSSFGYTVNLDFFMKTSDLNLFLSLQNQFNHEHYFPGIDVEISRKAVQFLGKKLLVTPRLAVWLQPKDQNFRTSESEPGVLVSVKTEFPFWKRYTTYLEIEGKTPGWVAGNVFLDENVSMRAGVEWFF